MVLRFESHVHTNFSDGSFYKLMIHTALKKRIDVIAITDHNTMQGYEFCRRYAQECSNRQKGEIFILPAEEVACPGGEVLAYGILDPIKKGTPMAEAIDQIHDQGGLAVIPHPFNFFTSVSPKIAKSNAFDGLEVINFGTFNTFNKLSMKYAKSQPQLFRIGGNDAHQPWSIGIVLNFIDAEPNTDSVLAALRKKKIKIYQSIESFPWRAHFFFKNYVGHVITYVLTGVKLQTRCLYKKHLQKRKK